tara:strand:- start:12 stop:281 length:270 start_codon:yes stop_codon:yes gene_type:complete
MSQNQEELTNENALRVLIQGCIKAQGSGCYTLDQAAIVSRAVKVFLTTSDNAENNANTENNVNNVNTSTKLDVITEETTDDILNDDIVI